MDKEGEGGGVQAPVRRLRHLPDGANDRPRQPKLKSSSLPVSPRSFLAWAKLGELQGSISPK